MRCDCGHKTWVYPVVAKVRKCCQRCAKKPFQLAFKYGKRFGSRISIRSRLHCFRQEWLMQCDCGQKKWISACLAKKYKRCPNCASKDSRVLVKIGTRIGTRVIAKQRMHNGRQYWFMQCDCGNQSWHLTSRFLFQRSRMCSNCSKVKVSNSLCHPLLTKNELQKLVKSYQWKQRQLKSLGAAACQN